MAKFDEEDVFQQLDSEIEDELETDGDVGRDLLVYMIDGGRDMFLPFGKEDIGVTETYFSAVIKSVTKDLKTRIISRDRDEVAICFFNTREKRNFQESSGVFVFQASDQDTRNQDELCQPTARLIKEFSCVNKIFDNVIGSMPGVVPGSRENPLYNALWVAQGLLRKGSVKNSAKRILLFTNNDDPFGDADAALKNDMRRMTIQRARDAQDLGISIDILPFSRPGEEFSVSIFYAHMIEMDEEERTNFFAIAKERLDAMDNQIQKRIFKKRAVRRLTLTIPNGMAISVQTFALIRQATPGQIAWVDSFDNKLLKSERSFICSDTGTLISEPLQCFQEYKSQKVCFSPHEVSEVKRVTGVQLQLLGFKPLKCLQVYHNMRPAIFLYPDEERISGSTCAFIALYKAMLRLRKYALAYLGTTSRMVALVPQEEITNEIGQIEPPGIHMIFLPFSDDIRHIEKFHTSIDGNVSKASDEQVQKAISMLKRIDLKDFSPAHYANPALQRHYAILEAVALLEDELPDPMDETMPPEEQMQKPAISQAVKEFKDSVYGPDHDLQEEEAAAEKLKGSAASQKRKAAEEVAAKDYEKYDWSELADAGKLKELTISELKLYLVRHKLQVTGKKEVIVNRILTHMGK